MALRDKNFNEIVTFTRASEGTFVDSDGLIKTALPNQPRFDHDPSTLEPLGLLVEESRTNLYTNSGSLVNTFGASGSVKSTNDLSLTPNGTFEGVRVFENDGNVQHGLELKPNAVSDVDFTLSIFAKKVDRDFAFLGLFDTDSNFSGITVDLNTAEVTRVNGGSLLGFKAEKHANGWVRISCSYPSSESNRGTILFLSDTADRGGSNGRPSYQGDPANSMLVWGYQVEKGSFPTSYIPTNGSEVTRVADQAVIDGERFSQFYNADEFTLFANVHTPFMDKRVGNDFFFGIAEKNTSNRYHFVNNYKVNSIELISLEESLLPAKAALIYKKDKTISSSVNGLVSDDRSNTLNTETFNVLDIGTFLSGTINSVNFAYFKALKFFPRALTDLELIQLTSPFEVQTAEVDTTQDPSFEADFINDSSTVAEA